MIKAFLEDVKFAFVFVVGILYILLLDACYQIRFSGYRGEFIVTYTKLQKVLSGMFFPLLIFGILFVVLMVYREYLEMIRHNKNLKAKKLAKSLK